MTLEARTRRYWHLSAQADDAIQGPFALLELSDLALDETEPRLRAAMLKRLDVPVIGGAGVDGGDAA